MSATVEMNFTYCHNPYQGLMVLLYSKFVTTDDSEPVQFTIFIYRRTYQEPSMTVTARKKELTRIVLPYPNSPLPYERRLKVQVKNSKNIIVYALDKRYSSFAPYLGLPYFETATETYNYYGTSSSTSSLKSGGSRGYMAVVILRDSTRLSLTPTVILEGNVPGTPARKIPGIEYTSSVLFKGQTFILTSTEDLTGSKISSNNPITFIIGVQCVSPSLTACKPLTQQLPPADTFGFVLFLIPLHLHRQTVYKLVASADHTSVFFLCVNNQGQIVLWNSFKLNEGQFRQINIDSDQYCSIEATLPVLVVKIVLKSSFNGTIVSDYFMTMVPPLGQYRNDYTFLFAFNSSINLTALEARLSLCVPVNCFNSSQILFDGQPLLDSVFYVPVKCKNVDVCAYCAQYEVPDAQAHGVHTLKHSNPNCTLGVIVSGHGRDSSYAYPGGMNLDSIAGNSDSTESYTMR